MQQLTRHMWRSPVNTGVVVGLLLAYVIGSGLWRLAWHERMLDATAACLKHQHALLDAIVAYAREHGERYPPARDWCDRVRPYVKDPQAFVCPAARNRRCSYAFNAQLSELPTDTLADGHPVVLLFESDRGWNAAGGRELLVERPRHWDYLDVWTRVHGTAFSISTKPGIARDDPSRVRWQPSVKPAGPGAGPGPSPPGGR